MDVTSEFLATSNKVITDIEPKVKIILSAKQEAAYRASLAWITRKCTNSGDSYKGSYAKCFLARFRDDQCYNDLPIGMNNAALAGLYECRNCDKGTPSATCIDAVYKKVQPIIYVLDVNVALQAHVNGYQNNCKKNAAAYFKCSEDSFAADIIEWQKLVDISKEINAGREQCVKKNQ